jgi:hypothetical protein
MILISAGLGLGATNTSILLNPPPDRPIGVEVEMQLRRVQVMAHDPKNRNRFSERIMRKIKVLQRPLRVQGRAAQ